MKWSSPGGEESCFKFLYVTHCLNSAYGSFIEGSIIQSWYYFVVCLWMVVSQFYQAVKWLQEAGGKQNEKKA